LEDVSGITPRGVSIALLLFGVGITLGNLIGGRLADWRLMPSIAIILCLLIVIQAVFTVTSHTAIPAVITVMVWGAFAFGVCPPLQMRVVDQARAAPSLASTVNQSAFNFGNAIGASAGGFMVSAGAGYAQLPWLGSAFSVVALGVVVFALWLERRGQRRRQDRRASVRAAATALREGEPA